MVQRNFIESNLMNFSPSCQRQLWHTPNHLEKILRFLWHNQITFITCSRFFSSNRVYLTCHDTKFLYFPFLCCIFEISQTKEALRIIELPTYFSFLFSVTSKGTSMIRSRHSKIVRCESQKLGTPSTIHHQGSVSKGAVKYLEAR